MSSDRIAGMDDAARPVASTQSDVFGPTEARVHLRALEFRSRAVLLQYAAGEIDAEAVKAFACTLQAAVREAFPVAEPNQRFTVVNEKTDVTIHFDADQFHFQTSALAADWLLRTCVNDATDQRCIALLARKIESQSTWDVSRRTIRDWAAQTQTTSR